MYFDTALWFFFPVSINFDIVFFIPQKQRSKGSFYKYHIALKEYMYNIYNLALKISQIFFFTNLDRK